MTMLQVCSSHRSCNSSACGFMFNIEAVGRSARLVALMAQTRQCAKSMVTKGTAVPRCKVTVYVVEGGFEAHVHQPADWEVAGEAWFTEHKKPTRIDLETTRIDLNLRAGSTVGIYLHSRDGGKLAVGIHSGDCSSTQGEGVLLHKGVFTSRPSPFDGVQTTDYFFVGSLEYELPPQLTAAPAEQQATAPAANQAAHTRRFSGVLSKKSCGIMTGGAWQRRFFAISGSSGNLEYAHTEAELVTHPKGVINLHQVSACARTGTLLTLTGGGGVAAVELQAETEGLAQVWEDQISQVMAERTKSLVLSMEQFAPRKGTLALCRKGSAKPPPSGGPGLAPPPSATPAIVTADDSVFSTLQQICIGPISLESVRELVGPRLQRVKSRFPSATPADLSTALVTYSPESVLFAKGYSSSEKIIDAPWEKYQGELFYGDDQAFYDGVKEVIGDDIADSGAIGMMRNEILQQGVPAEDRYNLWYIQHCAAVEQPAHDEEGKARTDARGRPSILDEGHGGMVLQDFTLKANEMLAACQSKKRVTDACILALRLYTASTFRRFNTSLRDKGMGKVSGSMALRACVQSARTCVLTLQAIPRPHEPTFRGATGFLGHEFQANGMGMDFAFFSTSLHEGVASQFGSAARSVLFEIAYLRGCQGAEVSMLSLYPAEKEVLFPPCTGLNLRNDTDSAASPPVTGKGAGQARVVVSPIPAH
jgi:hypothetical protein